MNSEVLHGRFFAELTQRIKRNSELIEAVSQFVEQLELSGLRVEAVYVYGSYATDTAHRDSDIDVAVISSDL